MTLFFFPRSQFSNCEKQNKEKQTHLPLDVSLEIAIQARPIVAANIPPNFIQFRCPILLILISH